MRQAVNWAGGRHEFFVSIAVLRQLQTARDTSPIALLNRLRGEDWFVDDIVDVLVFALAAAGMPMEQANNLVHEMWLKHGPIELVGTAQAVLISGLVGEPGDDAGKQVAAQASET